MARLDGRMELGPAYATESNNNGKEEVKIYFVKAIQKYFLKMTHSEALTHYLLSSSSKH